MDNQRKVFLDILRIIATLAVVAYHILICSASNAPTISSENLSMISGFSSTMQWHIMIFFIITGYLWLNKDKDCSYQKIFHNIRRFILTLFTFGFAYAIIERIFNTNEFTLKVFINGFIDVVKGNTWDHMWFLYTIIGIYLLLPIVKPFFDTQSTKTLYLVGLIIFFFAMIVPATEYIFEYTFPISFPITVSVFYVYAGGLLTKIKVPTRTISLVAMIIFFLNSTIIFLAKLNNLINIGLFPILICFSAFSLFFCIWGLFNDKKKFPWISNISKCTFGIYLIHPFFINFIIKFMHIYPLRNYPIVSFLIIWLIVVGFSYAITYLLCKIPLLKKYIL